MNRFLNEFDKNAWQNSVRKAIQFTWLISGNVRDVYYPNRRDQQRIRSIENLSLTFRTIIGRHTFVLFGCHRWSLFRRSNSIRTLKIYRKLSFFFFSLSPSLLLCCCQSSFAYESLFCHIPSIRKKCLRFMHRLSFSCLCLFSSMCILPSRRSI